MCGFINAELKPGFWRFWIIVNYVLTFPHEDLPVGAVVQDEAVVTDQQLFAKRALGRHLGGRHGTRRIRHLIGRMKTGSCRHR